MEAKMNGKGKAGRKGKLTSELQAEICQLIEKGNYISTACQACGIGSTAYYRWLEQGKKDEEGIYKGFLEAVNVAEAKAVTANVKVIKTASETSWQAAAWLLERKNPEDWGAKQRTEHRITGDIKVISYIPDHADPLEIVVKKPEELKEGETSNAERK